MRKHFDSGFLAGALSGLIMAGLITAVFALLPDSIPKMSRAEELATANAQYEEANKRALVQIGGEHINRLRCQVCHNSKVGK